MTDLADSLRRVAAVQAVYDASYPPDVLANPDDPHIASLSPSSGSAAAGPILITVNGTNFVAGSVVEIAQQEQPTTFVDATHLTVNWDPPAPITVNFTVRNPDDEESNSVPFNVTAVTQQDIDGWTIDAVKAFVVEHPDLLAEVTDFEERGKKRTSLLAWLNDLLDEEDPTPDDPETSHDPTPA